MNENVQRKQAAPETSVCATDAGRGKCWDDVVTKPVAADAYMLLTVLWGFVHSWLILCVN